MADDDTSIDPIALAVYLQRFTADKPVYAGIMPYGGAGFVVSRATLQALRERVDYTALAWSHHHNQTHSSIAWAAAPVGAGHVMPTLVEKCVNEMFGGTMCFYNSDW